MKTRIITAIVGILVLIGVLFTFDTLVFNFVIAAITLIAIHEVFKALGFGRKDWPMYAVFVPYTLLIMLSSYQVWRRLVMPASFLMVLFFGIYLVVRNAQVDFAKASGLVMFSGIVIFCFYSFIRLKELLPVVETYRAYQAADSRRREAEELAQAPKEHALCSNACLLARALETEEGSPVFSGGEAVLAGLRVEEIAALAKTWSQFNREENPALTMGQEEAETLKKN